MIAKYNTMKPHHILISLMMTMTSTKLNSELQKSISKV